MRQRRTIPVEKREKILAAYDAGTSTREAVARRFRVSLGMVKKLLQQRREEGDIAPLHHRAGRKPLIDARYQKKMQTLLKRKPGLTLRALRDALGLECTLQAIHMALNRMGLSRAERQPKPPVEPPVKKAAKTVAKVVAKRRR